MSRASRPLRSLSREDPRSRFPLKRSERMPSGTTRHLEAGSPRSLHTSPVARLIGMTRSSASNVRRTRSGYGHTGVVASRPFTIAAVETRLRRRSRCKGTTSAAVTIEENRIASISRDLARRRISRSACARKSGVRIARSFQRLRSTRARRSISLRTARLL